jgi:hypothetical protein
VVAAEPGERYVDHASMETRRRRLYDAGMSRGCHGDMATLAQFLYAVEKGPMALKVVSAELSSHDTIGQQLSLALEVSGLVLTPQTQ